jgi:Mg2+ and Co2+ transporter CorA
LYCAPLRRALAEPKVPSSGQRSQQTEATVSSAYASAMARTRLYSSGVLVTEDFPISDVHDYLSERDALVWIDLCAPHSDELTLVTDALGLHELAVQDAVDRHERPNSITTRHTSSSTCTPSAWMPRLGG